MGVVELVVVVKGAWALSVYGACVETMRAEKH